MALRTILTYGDPALRKTCRPVTQLNEHIFELLDDLTQTMRNVYGVGLAAPQVGVLRRVAVVEVDDKLYELINPELIEASGEQTGDEGCLSLPGYEGTVTRPMKVKIKSLDRSGNEIFYEAEELTARAFLHEMDHLDGIVYKDKAVNFRECADEEDVED